MSKNKPNFTYFNEPQITVQNFVVAFSFSRYETGYKMISVADM